MHSKHTFLFLVPLALLALWWLFSGKESTTTGADPVVVTEAGGALEAAPALVESGPARQEVALPSAPESVPEPVVPPAEVPEPETGFVTGRIVDSHGLVVAKGKVLVFDGKTLIATQALDEGTPQFRFELEAERGYFLFVDPTSLPAGYSPPFQRAAPAEVFEEDAEAAPLDRIAPQYVEIEAGKERVVDMQVAMLSRGSGQVIDAEGNPLPGIYVRISRLERLAGNFSTYAITDELGRFAFPDLFPGHYRLAIVLGEDAGPEDETWNPPPPLEVFLVAGQPQDFGQLVVGAGTCAIEGRIVNQDGQGFGGLRVVCFSGEPVEEGLQGHNFGAPLAQARTDAEGYYSLVGLEAMKVQISLTPDFSPGEAPGAGKPAMWVPNLEVDLEKDGPHVQLGDSVVDESRPFPIQGKLVGAPAWLAAGNHPSDVRVEIDQVPGHVLPEGVRRNAVWRQRLRVDGDTGTFTYQAETPSTPLVLRLTLRGFEPLELIVEPIEGLTWDRQIQIPGDLEKSP